MKFANPSKLDRKSGIRLGDRGAPVDCLPALPQNQEQERATTNPVNLRNVAGTNQHQQNADADTKD
jgi:hypothetical protein